MLGYHPGIHHKPSCRDTNPAHCSSHRPSKNSSARKGQHLLLHSTLPYPSSALPPPPPPPSAAAAAAPGPLLMLTIVRRVPSRLCPGRVVLSMGTTCRQRTVQ